MLPEWTQPEDVEANENLKRVLKMGLDNMEGE